MHFFPLDQGEILVSLAAEHDAKDLGISILVELFVKWFLSDGLSMTHITDLFANAHGHSTQDFETKAGFVAFFSFLPIRR